MTWLHDSCPITRLEEGGLQIDYKLQIGLQIGLQKHTADKVAQMADIIWHIHHSMMIIIMIYIAPLGIRKEYSEVLNALSFYETLELT